MAAKTKALTPTRAAKKVEAGTFTDPSGKVFRHSVPTKLNKTETSGLKVDVSSGSNLVEIEIDEEGNARVKS